MAKSDIVITRTPLRVSFIGGGSDTGEYYRTAGPGQVVSLALNKYIYVAVKRHAPIFGERYRLSYSKNEIVDSLDDIENNIIRECIRFSEIDDPLYISTFSDIPAASGLGSSSALAVGLLNALHSLKEDPITRGQLAEEACYVEIDKLKSPIGKQDQYAVAFGGMNHFRFFADERVATESVDLPSDYLSEFLSSASLFWTGLSRQAGSILTEQKANFSAGKIDEVSRMVEMVPEFLDMIRTQRPISEVAELISHSWLLKQKFASKISSPDVANMFDMLVNFGGWGGKLCGGGGGGFILMFHDPAAGQNISERSNSKYRLELGMDFAGSVVLEAS